MGHILRARLSFEGLHCNKKPLRHSGRRFHQNKTQTLVSPEHITLERLGLSGGRGKNQLKSLLSYSSRSSPWTSSTSSQGSTPNAAASFRRVLGCAPRLPNSSSAMVALETPERSESSICENDALSLSSLRRLVLSTLILPRQASCTIIGLK